MQWVLQNKAWVLGILGVALVLALLPLFSQIADYVSRRLRAAPQPPRRAPSNLRTFPSPRDAKAQPIQRSAVETESYAERWASSAAPPPPPMREAEPAQAACDAASATASDVDLATGLSFSLRGYHETPGAFAIVTEVCGLQPPVRDRVAESYRGLRVRWMLRLAAMSPGEGTVHSMRMYPKGRTANSCGVYFTANLDEHPVLEDAQQDELFVVEATIENVSGLDIDLTDVQTIEKAAERAA